MGQFNVQQTCSVLITVERFYPESHDSLANNLEFLEGQTHSYFHYYNPRNLLSTSMWHLKLALGLKKKIPNIIHKAMVIRQPSLDINEYSCSFASMITNFMNNHLSLTYEQLLEFRIQEIQVCSENNPLQVNWQYSISTKILCSMYTPSLKIVPQFNKNFDDGSKNVWNLWQSESTKRV